jgi:chromosome segregation ATPase
VDLTQIVGSLGGVSALILAFSELAKRIRNRRSDDRIANANAEGLELDNAAKLKRLWDDQFADMQTQIDAVQADMGKARRAWERERADLLRQVRELQKERKGDQTRIGELEESVDALRSQIRAAGLTPAA